MFPESAAVPPPPPPPPPAPTHPAWLPWTLGLAAAAAAAVVVVVLLMGGGDSSAASTTTSTTATTTTTLGTTTTATTTTILGTTTTATTTTLDQSHYTEAELAYLAAIAGQAEFGPEGGEVHKWVEDLRILVIGDPTRRDREVLDNVIGDLNELLDPIELTLVESDPNVEIHFVPQADFASIEPNYVPGNMGFIYIWRDGAGAITDARVLISTTDLTPAERAHLIREELTQGLGLLNDTNDYPNSMFYQGWTTTNRFAPIDRALIEMLYRPELVPGMTIADALDLLAEVVRD